MSTQKHATALEQTRFQIKELVEKKRMLDTEVTVLARPLTPEEAIGHPGRRDFPIIIGKERVIEATVRGARGHAFTDSPQEYVGTLKEVLEYELTTNQNRAIYTATLNALLSYFKLADKTIHCKDEETEECAVEIADSLLRNYGRTDVGLIGLNPAIAERLIDAFGQDHVRITDLNRDIIGEQRFGVEIWDGNTRTDELIKASAVIIFTGTTLVNDTFDQILDRIKALGKGYVVYGVTAAGVCHMRGIERICPRGRDGADAKTLEE